MKKLFAPFFNIALPIAGILSVVQSPVLAAEPRFATGNKVFSEAGFRIRVPDPNRIDQVNAEITVSALRAALLFWNAFAKKLYKEGLNQVHVVQKPRPLKDNGASYVSADPAEWLQDKGMEHSLSAPYHLQTPVKTASQRGNQRLLKNYFLSGDLEAFVTIKNWKTT